MIPDTKPCPRCEGQGFDRLALVDSGRSGESCPRCAGTGRLDTRCTCGPTFGAVCGPGDCSLKPAAEAATESAPAAAPSTRTRSEVLQACPTCDATGYELCGYCQGNGDAHGGGYACNQCGGEGVFMCDDCNGTGGPVLAEYTEDGALAFLVPAPGGAAAEAGK